MIKQCTDEIYEVIGILSSHLNEIEPALEMFCTSCCIEWEAVRDQLDSDSRADLVLLLSGGTLGLGRKALLARRIIDVIEGSD